MIDRPVYSLSYMLFNSILLNRNQQVKFAHNFLIPENYSVCDDLTA